MKEKVYKSKFGWGIFLFMAALFLIISWINYAPEQGLIGGAFLFVVSIVTLGLFAIMSLSTKYTILATELHIKCLPFYNKRIAVDRIKKVKLSRNLISSPAPSLDRIEIFYDKFDSVVISPKDKIQFMEDLKLINPSIELLKKYS